MGEWPGAGPAPAPPGGRCAASRRVGGTAHTQKLSSIMCMKRIHPVLCSPIYLVATVSGIQYAIINIRDGDHKG